MPAKVHRCKPVLKIGESAPDQGNVAYIIFDEYVDIPGLENADIRIEFERNNSFAEISDLLSRIESCRPILVVQRN